MGIIHDRIKHDPNTTVQVFGSVKGLTMDGFLSIYIDSYLTNIVMTNQPTTLTASLMPVTPSNTPSKRCKFLPRSEKYVIIKFILYLTLLYTVFLHSKPIYKPSPTSNQILNECELAIGSPTSTSTIASLLSQQQLTGFSHDLGSPTLYSISALPLPILPVKDGIFDTSHSEHLAGLKDVDSIPECIDKEPMMKKSGQKKNVS
jgi:hypothetical protein